MDLILPAFERRLRPEAERPIAVAYSGGGDSLFALLAAKAWADRVGRHIVALHVDHQLQPVSRDWADQAEAVAAQLGAGFRRLAWIGDKPRSGLAAAARRARHALIAEAAREAGASVIVFGHTADDGLEAELMRAEGSSLGRPREWAPSPVWPEGRDLFLLRPLLALRREEIRQRLAPLGLAWIEDPANSDPTSVRARARVQLAGAGEASVATPDGLDQAVVALAKAAEIGPAGTLDLDRAALLAVPPKAAQRFLSAALVSVGGGERPPKRERLAALFARIVGGEPFVATLAGARLEAGERLHLVRETGAYRRRGPPQLRLEPGEVGVWDGRFEIANRGAEPLSLRPLSGLAHSLPREQQAALKAWPPAVRPSLPVVTPRTGAWACPMLSLDDKTSWRPLAAGRVFSACGLISEEPAERTCWRGVDARGGMTTGVLCLEPSRLPIEGEVNESA